MDEEGPSKELTEGSRSPQTNLNSDGSYSVAIRDSDDPHSFKEIRKAIQEVSSVSSKTLDLSRRRIKCLTADINQVSHIENLYLEGNALSQLPENLFHQLPNLTWLDLRNNELRSLPSSIGSHRFLKTLLLEGNPIKQLPVELGCLNTLKALNLRYCPLEFPPQDVVHQGLKAIQIFLRNAAKDDSCQQSPFKEVPIVERLKLGDSVKSSLNLSEEWGNEEEKEEFQRLRQQIIQEEEKEFFLSQYKAYDALSLPEKFKQIMHVKQDEAYRRQRMPVNLRIKRASLYGNLPEVQSYNLQILPKTKKERQLTALKELKEKQALIEQRRKDKDMLLEWRKQTKMAQEKKEREKRLQDLELARGDQVVRSAPYATDPNHYRMIDSQERMKQNVSKQHEHIRTPARKSVKEAGDRRNALDRELEQRIRQHIQTMHERRRKPKGTVQEELELAIKEVNCFEKLQTEVAQRKLQQDLPVEFTAFTGTPSSHHTTTALPRSIFSNNKF